MRQLVFVGFMKKNNNTVIDFTYLILIYLLQLFILTFISKKLNTMKHLIQLCGAALIVAMMWGCGSKTSVPALESNGYFGKLASIKQNFQLDDSTLSAKAKTEVKSMDDIVAMQSKMNKLKQDAQAEFAKEAGQLKLPITVTFVDSAGGAGFVVKDAKITAVDWDRATLTASVELKTDSEKSAGGQNMQFTVPALMLDSNGKLLKDHSDVAWLIFASTKEMKAGETHEVTGYLVMNKNSAALNKLVFKSYDEYKKAKGWN